MKQASDVIWKPVSTNCPMCNHSVTPRSTGNGREVECPGCEYRWVEMEVLPRPVGHITNLMRELDRWAKARERKIDLDANLLRTAIAYLGEYRELLARGVSDDGRD